MGSRVRSPPSSLLECWCEVVAGQGPDQPPWIIHKFPSTFDDQQTLNSIPQFVFPCKIETNVVLNFSFVLTALDSKFTFGFCRHSPNAESALVVLSHLPWDSTFYKILNLCSELQSSESPDDVWSFLKTLYTAPVPEPGSDLTLTYPPANKMFVTRCPNHLTLPSIPDNRNLLEYINAVGPETMMVVFASLLFERRIVISSKHLHRVSACVQAANALLYPMSWQHIYIPILPEPLLDYLLAPMPYLIGVPDVLMQKVPLDEMRDVVHLNADTNHIITPYSDLAELPSDVCTQLRRRLTEPGQGMGDGVPRAFLRALVMLIGNYRDALQFNEDDRKVFFNTERFVASRPQHLQVFVEKMLELQIFRQFIEEREEQVNRGVATSDEFEMEVSVYNDKPRKNYQQLMHAVKKEGGAIVKNFKSKTNPAMKSAVKSVSKSSKQVRERGAEKYKEFRGKMKLPSTRSPEHVPWTPPEAEDRTPPPSPPSRLPTHRPNADVTAKVSYKRPMTNHVNRNEGVGVPSSGSASSFRSPESPGHTPAPHTIDLVGELEEELFSRLSEPSTGRPSLSSAASTRQSVNDGRRSSLSRPTTLPPPVPSAVPPSATSRSQAPPRDSEKDSPTTPGLSGTKDQDLILLGSPHEEETVSMLSKSLAPPLPRSGPPPLDDLDPLAPPPPRPSAPHPVPSFLHSSRIQHTSVTRPENGVQAANADGKGSCSSSSSSSLSSIYQPYIPFTSSLNDIKSPPADLLSPLTPNSSSLPDFSASCSSTTLATTSTTATTTKTTSAGGVGQPLGIIPLPRPRPAPPLLPTPARRPHSSGPLSGSQKRGNSIPSSTMASLPAALQNHLANQLGSAPPLKPQREPPAKPDDSEFVPFFTRFQNTTTAPPAAQNNPLYNPHELALGGKFKPQSSSSYPKPTLSSYPSVMTSSYSSSTASHSLPGTAAQSSSVASSATQVVKPTLNNSNPTAKPNFAAAFASTMINNSARLPQSTPNLINNNNNNNNIDEPKMLGSFSESFAQMKLNQSGERKSPATEKNELPAAQERKPGWTSFE